MAENLEKEHFLATTKAKPRSTSISGLPVSGIDKAQNKHNSIRISAGNNTSSSNEKASKICGPTVAELPAKPTAGTLLNKDKTVFIPEHTCTELNDISECSLAENIYQRFQARLHYTDVAPGEDIIFTGPLQPASSTSRTDAKAQIQYARLENLHKLPPHIYRQVFACHRRAFDENLEQCLVFSGSSNSGKTENLRKAVSFLTFTSRQSPAAGKACLVLKVMSGFCSACSSQNFFRTRIAYLLDFSLDFKGEILGVSLSAVITEKAYLSPNPAVSSPDSSSEMVQSSFHIFYALLHGASLQLLKSLKLKRNANNYRYLNKTVELSRSSVQNFTCDTSLLMSTDWAKPIFTQVEEALTKLNFTKNDQVSIWFILAIILKLGNLDFQPTINLDGTPGCLLLQEYELHEICQMLNCNSQNLHCILTSHLIDNSSSKAGTTGTSSTSSSLVRIEFTADEAQRNLHDICRALYTRLINCLFQKINAATIRSPISGLPPPRHLGFLDCPGFDESIQVSYFDQLCCNYAQEKLHWYFLSGRLKEQQKLYILEGIQWCPIDVISNSAVVCEHIESSMSILDQCTEVEYKVENFVEKNLECISSECSKLLYECNKACPLLQQMFPEGCAKQLHIARKSGQARKRLSTCAQFKLSVNSLLSVLKDRHCTHVFCIRPNNIGSTESFDQTAVRNQIELLKSCHTADTYIKMLYHRWRCRKYRAGIDQQTYFRLREKLAASLIFKDNKTGYTLTVSHPFRGDYVRLRQNPKWRRVSLDTSDEYVVFADMVSKIHRSSGKVSTLLLVLSTSGVLILDHRTLTVKHRVAVEEIPRISVSPYGDTLAVFHLAKSALLSRKPGDFLFECRHCIELIAKLYLVIQNATGKPPQVEINSCVLMECESEQIELIVKAPGTPSTEDSIEIADLSTKLTSCFQSPSSTIRYSTTSPTTAMNLGINISPDMYILRDNIL